MDGRTPNRYDFDALMNLAERDPGAFEVVRQQLIDDAIEQAPEQRRQRLRGLQWRVDLTRRHAGTPMAACIRLSQLMWDSVVGERGLVEALHMAPRQESPRSAEIVELPPTRRD